MQQTPRKLEQSRVQVTLRVTPPESVTDWQSLSAAHGPRSPSRSCGRRSDQSDPHGASRLSGDPLSRTPKDRQSPRNRTDPPPLSEWDPLVILRSPSGSLGVQPARSRTTPPGVGRGRRQGGIWRSWPTLVSRLLGLLPNRGVCECDLAHRRLYGGCLLRHKKCVEFASQFVSSWDLIAE